MAVLACRRRQKIKIKISQNQRKKNFARQFYEYDFFWDGHYNDDRHDRSLH